MNTLLAFTVDVSGLTKSVETGVFNVADVHIMLGGRIVETGTPADLRRQGGLYARLAALQLEL